MQNSLVHNFLGLLSAIVTDIVADKPALQRDLDRDLVRIRSLASNCGVYLFLGTLPSLRKQLDSSLSLKYLTLEGPLTRAYRSGSRIPRLFRGMWSALFDDVGNLKDDIDPNIVLYFRTLLDVGNKYALACPPSAVFAEVREFYENDVTLPPPSPIWDGDGNIDADHFNISINELSMVDANQYDLFRSYDSDDTKLLDSVQRVADYVSSSLGEFNPFEMSFRYGRGAVADGLRGREKYLPTRWSQRLSTIFPPDTTVVPIGGLESIEETREIHSVLLAVPKTIKGPRLIAKEPADHGVCQLGIMDMLYERVGTNPYLRGSIDFRRQDFSQRLALEGSKDGLTCTIDLKSASDRISCWLIERLFRRNKSLLSCLIASRTRYISLEIDKALPSLHKLRKFSTQGSGVTFPIQSIVFAMLCVGANSVDTADPKVIRRRFRSVRVYGDDIIVPTSWLPNVLKLFPRLFLRINTQKTHSHGSFRESCGVDAWDGYDVTPPHITQFVQQSGHRAVSSVVQCANNFFTRGLWRAAAYLDSTVARKDFKLIPVRELPDVPLHLISFLGNAPPLANSVRWNSDLQREETRVLAIVADKHSLEVEGSRQLCAFLMRAEYGNRSPFLGMVPEITYSSRWEIREKVSRVWVEL